eukprot:EG_transcript_22652
MDSSRNESTQWSTTAIVCVTALLSVCVGATAGFIASQPSTNLYAPTAAVKPINIAPLPVSSAARAPLPLHAVRVPQDGQILEDSMFTTSSSEANQGQPWLTCALAGLAFSAASLLTFLRKPKTEENYAMLAEIATDPKEDKRYRTGPWPEKGFELSGRVISTTMDKTAVVLVERRILDTKYHKFKRVTKKYKAHDEFNEYKNGDEVVIRLSRPISKTKSFVVIGKLLK